MLSLLHRPVDVLFLDSGVAFPAGNTVLSAFLAWLDAEKPLKVVFTDEYRLNVSRSAMCNRIPALSRHVIGTTPVIEDIRKPAYPGEIPHAHLREREILTFLRGRRRTRRGMPRVRYWLAVDGNPEAYSPEFQKDRHFVISPQRGLQHWEIPRLLQKLLSRPSHWEDIPRRRA